MKNIKNQLLLILFTTILVNTTFAQEKKIKKVQELISDHDYNNANDIILKILEKNPNLSCAKFYSAVLDFKQGKSTDTVLKKLNSCELYFQSITKEQCISDSISFGYTKLKLELMMFELSTFAYDNYYKLSNTIDSLNQFKSKYKITESQKKYVNDRICQIAANKITNNSEREVLINFIQNYIDCTQLGLVKSKLEELDWKVAKNAHTKLSYLNFKSNYPLSVFSDSISEKIELLTWNEVFKKDSIESYLNYIENHPKSSFLTIAKLKYDTLLWQKSCFKLDTSSMMQYINNCKLCEFKIQALDNLANIEWGSIANSADTNTVNIFIKKWPNYSKIEIVQKRKNQLLYDNFHKNNTIINKKESDAWLQKLALYDKSKSKYLRTKVYSIGSKGVIDRISQNINVLLDVDEMVIGDYNDILYSVKYTSNELNKQYGRKLVSNDNGILGLEITNFHIAQQLSETYFTFSSGNQVFNSKTGEFSNLRMPKYDFHFNKLNCFPYLRVGCPDYLFSRDFDNRGNSDYKPSVNNSDLYYSIEKNKLTGITNIGKDYDVIFGSGKKYCKINKYKNELYNIQNLEVVTLNFDNLIDGNPNGLKNGSHTYEQIPAPIVAFNDSVCISYFKRDNLLKLYYYSTQKVDTIHLNFYPKIKEIEHIEIDQFSRYLYIEFEPDNFGEKQFTSPYNHSLLSIFDCKTKNIVYLGPYIGIDHTSEKIGWVMTKAFDCFKKETVKISTKKLDNVYKYGMVWNLTNYQPPIGKNEFINSSQVATIERSLINLSTLMYDDFLNVLNKKIAQLSPVEDIFNTNFVAERKQFLMDSLIACSHLWSKGNVAQLSDSTTKKTNDYKYDVSIINHIEKYSEELPHPNGQYLYFTPRLLNLKRDNKLFTFSFRIDSLPIDLLELNAKLPGTDPNPFDEITEYFETVYFKEKYAGNLKRTNESIVKDNVDFFHYDFEIITDDENIARLLNDLIKDKVISASLSREYNDASILNSLEVELINKYYTTSNLTSNHYWFEVLKECAKQGVGIWVVSLDFYVELWKIPALLNTPPKLQLLGKY
jgi:hypothetical protein